MPRKRTNMKFRGPFANSGRRPVRRARRKELDGLESVPRLLFLWSRRPRIAAANPRDHVGRHKAVATMVLMGHLSGYRGCSTAFLRERFRSYSDTAEEAICPIGYHFAVG